MSNLDWPRGARACEGDEEEREALAKRMRAAHERAWDRHESVRTLLRTHFPAAWERVQFCRMDEVYDYKLREYPDEPNLVILRPECRERPFCPACNDVATWRRASGIVNRIRACTPRKKKPSAWIFTVGVSPPRGDWRLPQLVAGDVQRFKCAIYAATETIFGAKVGAFATYQHFGQDVLVREHPHVHVIVNGWRLDAEGHAQRTPEYDLTDGGRARLNEIVAACLNAAFPEAGNARPEAWMEPRDVDLQRLDGDASVAKAAKYVAREIIDFRDFEFAPLKRLVFVNPYRQQGPAIIDVPTLQRNLSLYNARYQPWAGGAGRRIFDSAFGELSDRRAGETSLAMGGARRHRDGCWCQECSHWGRLLSERMEVEGNTLDDGAAPGWGA
jgi:hypothetical protein